MKKIFSYLGVFLFMGLMVGCYDDDSKTPHLSLPKITIIDDVQTGGITRVANVGEEFDLFCPVDWGLEDSTKFNFEWTYDGEVISSERSAKCIFPEAGTAYVEFKVSEKATGLTIASSIGVTVSSKWLLGWLILAEGEGLESNLHFIHIDTHELTRNVYKTLQPDNSLGSQPYRLEQKCKTNKDQILVMQRGGDGLVELDGSNFKKVIRTEDEFIGEQYPYEGFDPAFFLSAWCSQSYGPEYLVTTKGEVYPRIDRSSANFNLQQFISVPMDFPGGAKITRMTFPAFTVCQLMWDDLNKKWRSTYKQVYNDQLLPDIEKMYDEEDPANADIIDCFAGLPSGTEMVYAETMKETTYNTNLVNVFKTGAGKYTFQKVYLNLNRTKMALEASNIEQADFSGLGINDDTEFCLLRGTNTWAVNSPYLFFSVGKKVYFYAHTYKKVFLFKDCALGDNAPTGKIVSMHTDPKQRRLGIAFDDGHFYICDFFNEKGDNMLLEIARGSMDPTNLTDAAKMELKHFDGLGKIVHSIFKFGNWKNYYGATDVNR